jgi:hypothetical protein
MVHRRPRLLTAAEAMGRRCRHRRRKRERTRLQQMQQLLVLMLCTAAVVASLAAPASRSAIHKKRRMVWAERCASLNDREFTRRYRVNHDGFHYILDHIAPHMPPYRESAQEPHEHAVILSAVLRWCAGGHYLDICDLHGISESRFYAVLWSTLELIDREPAFALPLLDKLEDVEGGALETLAATFDCKTDGLMEGCISVIDGLQVKIEMPSADGSKYYCRKGFYSINVQAACDGNRRFTYMSAWFCGSTHDSVAYQESSLGRVLQDPDHPIQRTKYWVGGDAAYRGPANRCESLLTPYDGHGLPVEFDAYNYYHSKLRIDIEAAFGALVKRWGVLHGALRCATKRLDHAMTLISVLFKLHNIAHDFRAQENGGRLTHDSHCGYSPQQHNGQDMHGTHHPEWGIPWTTELWGDDLVVPRVARGQAAQQAQPLRRALTARLAVAGRVRPDHSNYSYQ